MNISQKINELLLNKYHSNIELFGNYDVNKSALLIDSKSGALFTITDDFLFSFKDKDDNSWSTIPKSLFINGKEYYPNIGDSITRNDGITHFFTTKEKVLEKALKYFESHIDRYYGLEVEWSVSSFHEYIKRERCSYKLFDTKFKSAEFDFIDYYISSN